MRFGSCLGYLFIKDWDRNEICYWLNEGDVCYLVNNWSKKEEEEKEIMLYDIVYVFLCFLFMCGF